MRRCRLGAHLAAGADPLSVGNLGERRVQAVDVVGGGAGVTAEQLSAVLTHSAELNVVVVFLLHAIISSVVIILPFSLGQIISSLPLDPLLLLGVAIRHEEEVVRVEWGREVCGMA